MSRGRYSPMTFIDGLILGALIGMLGVLLLQKLIG